jgi:hypothetical protein
MESETGFQFPFMIPCRASDPDSTRLDTTARRDLAVNHSRNLACDVQILRGGSMPSYAKTFTPQSYI